ncbi:MFS transporter [Paenibacillus selenitireducens]|uniref:MFS transporter n=1 Tax=Paenibacillus selenitireducens TaxID=1324314 RepID=A0A1T2X1M5_9BACL|nr:sugar efflux transporter [Paenibacillus selenitireducens]OPA73626.1 MFS transporter [Paenibacillus selenitireducens]
MYTRIKNLFEIKGYRLFVICLLLVGIGISMTMPYLSLYHTKELGMSAGAYGVFIAVSSLSGVIVNTLIAKHSDNGMDRKWLIISAMLSLALGYASYLVFHNIFILMIVVTLFNGFGAAAMPQIYAYAQESANASQSNDKTFALSTLRSLVALGFILGPLAGTLVLGVVGYKGLFLGSAVIYLTIASLVFLFLQKRKAIQNYTGKRKGTNISLFKSKQIRQPLIAFVFLFAVNAMNAIITPLFIVNELHGTYSDVGLVVMLSASLEIPMMIFLGALGRRISNHRLMISGCMIAIIYFIILSVATHSWHLIAAQLFQAMFVAIVMGNGLSYFADLLPNSPGQSSTLYANGSTLGRLVGNLSGGMIADFAGFRHVYWLCLAFVIFSLVILWKTRLRREKEVSSEFTRSV